MDADSSDSADLSSSLCPHGAPTRRLPTRVVRHGPGRRQSGRFVQLRKELYFVVVHQSAWLQSTESTSVKPTP